MKKAITLTIALLITAASHAQMNQGYQGQYGDNTPPPNFWQFDRDASDNIPYPVAVQNAAAAVGQALGIAEQAARAAAMLPPGNYTIQQPGQRYSNTQIHPNNQQRQEIIINGRRYAPIQ